MTGLVLERSLSAPPGQVWHALTDATALAGWFWPDRLRPRAETDPRPGGAWSMTGDGLAVGGHYVSVEPTERLAFTWQWDGSDLETTVTIELSTVDALASGTTLSLRHSGFTEEADRENHVVGWTDCLDRLAAADLSGAEAAEL